MTGPMNAGGFGGFGPMNGAETAGRCGSPAGGAATPVLAGAGRDEDFRGEGDGDGDTRGEAAGDADGLLRLLPLPLPLPLPFLPLLPLPLLAGVGDALAGGQQRCAVAGEGEGLVLGCGLAP
jgi:hypothetical protein